jgi:ABC-type dipeptide/oligopeptide/nickel transport system permease component
MTPVVRYLIRRILLTIPVLIGVATLVFSLIHLVPEDPAQAMFGVGASERDLADLRSRLGLDRPLLEQYARFMCGVARGDLGTSFRTGQPVVGAILEWVPATIELAMAAMTVALAGISIPNFWLGPM